MKAITMWNNRQHEYARLLREKRMLKIKIDYLTSEITSYEKLKDADKIIRNRNSILKCYSSIREIDKELKNYKH